MIHGQAHTGTSFLKKQDDDLSWSSQFIEAGHTVHIVDQNFRCRLTWAPRSSVVSPTTFSAEYIKQLLSPPNDLISVLKLSSTLSGPA